MQSGNASGRRGTAAEEGEDARHASNADRRADRAQIVDDIQAILRTKPRDEWLAIFMQAKVPAGPVNSVDDIARDPELLARGLLYTAEGGGRRVPQVGLGIGIDGANATYRSPPPKLGEHTASILRDWLGYDMQAVAALRLQKLI
jgi:crotonobetainyl-CoA:carnitine CoA-transferase CaiB-like acyl-CoA transferase